MRRSRGFHSATPGEQPPDSFVLETSRLPSWGRGYATEAAAGIRDAAFSRWSYARVISLIRPINLPSRRVAERIGMTIERTVRHVGMEHLLYSIAQWGE